MLKRTKKVPKKDKKALKEHKKGIKGPKRGKNVIYTWNSSMPDENTTKHWLHFQFSPDSETAPKAGC